MSEIKILMVGDIVGKPGRKAVSKLLDNIVKEHSIRFVIANGENAAGGYGITPVLTKELLDMGIDVITTGNHVFQQKQILDFIDKEPRLLRPANYSSNFPGKGVFVKELGDFSIAVINLQGKIFMDQEVANPFTTADSILESLPKSINLTFIDFHAEATSEKIALGYYLDGQVTAVVGTHTHVQTADEKVLPKGTAFLADVGMTGPIHSVIGVTVERSVTRFVTEKKQSFTVAKGMARLDGCIICADPLSGLAKSIQTLQINLK